jgi:NAD(P)-dependent dehydrogenase (short-subunit alcohol dehydrogenase family)
LKSYKDKVVIVTGASRGIGLLLTRRFAHAGAKVVFGARRQNELAKIEEELFQDGLTAKSVVCDVGRPEDCEKLVTTAIEMFGPVDILVNNAGVSGVQKSCWELSSDELDEVMRINVNGPLNCTRVAAQSMIPRRSGVIINIGSFTGKRPALKRGVYATSKMALIGLTRTCALELAEHNIRCNLISPGPVLGERVEEVVSRAAQAQGVTRDEIRSSFKSWMPLGEMVTEDEICDMVFFLTSDSGRHITGQDINMDSGIVMF